MFRYPLSRPRGTGNVPEPCRGEVESGLSIGERAHDAQDAFERDVAPNSYPATPCRPHRRNRTERDI
jgi:hypothetical protein